MWLNYQHLHYFWIVARSPSLTAAAKRLSLAPSTVSAQIKALETALEQNLFERRGRGLQLTEHGRVILAYADDIFALGEELIDAARTRLGPRHVQRFRVGISNNLPKLVAHRLIAPACNLPDCPIHLVCLEDRGDRLVADVAASHLDLVITDQAVALVSEVRVESTLLGDCGVSLMATPSLAARYLNNFPHSLEGAPLLLPDPGAAMRQLVERFFHDLGVRPHVVAEFGDSALLKSFGQAGMGLFPTPSLVANDVAAQYRVVEVGQLKSVRERFFAAYKPGRETHPAIAAVLGAAAGVLDHSL
jgi:LysR family transcriptional activator of nhaA